jgi:hypothetical protein
VSGAVAARARAHRALSRGLPPLATLMLGHSDIKTTQRYLSITDEELRKALTGVWERRRPRTLSDGYPAPPRGCDPAAALWRDVSSVSGF